MNDLHETARALVAEDKGILAADESTGTIKKRFDSIGIESTEDTRRVYRELLFTTPGAEEYISGVILYDETIRQSASDGTPFPKLLESKGIIPGIKVDEGAKPLALSDRPGRAGRSRVGPRSGRDPVCEPQPIWPSVIWSACSRLWVDDPDSHRKSPVIRGF